MAQLAIKGHATRGKEVVELLEMLGGGNPNVAIGNSENVLYFIHNNVIQFWNNDDLDLSNFIIFTLEEFLEKFPYKIGDKVIDRIDGCVGIVDEMIWDGSSIKYDVTFGYGLDYRCYLAQSLQPYKEETMEEINIGRIGFNGNKAKLILPDEYEFKTEGKEVYVVKKKPQYPKTYEECLEILNCSISHTIPMNHGHQGLLMMRFQRLLIFRDAYWKIAGDWKPEWSDTFIYSIGSSYGVVEKRMVSGSGILVFPTEEMRDAFYENFKGLIEECKELI